MAGSNIAANQHKNAGVDIAEADAGLSNIISRITATWPKSGFGAVQLPIGYFANVIEMAGIGPAPFVGMMLSDMGADVLRIDRPGNDRGTKIFVTRRGRKSVANDDRSARGDNRSRSVGPLPGGRLAGGGNLHPGSVRVPRRHCDVR